MFKIGGGLILLSEGLADKKCLEKLIEHRKLPQFEMPFPDGKLFSNSMFGKMLSAIQGDPSGFEKVKGVLIAADAGDDPVKTFASIQLQIREAGGFAVPERLLGTASLGVGNPLIAVMLLPEEGQPGSLESLYVEALACQHDWLLPCVEAFLGCGRGRAATWPAEKLAKARFAAMVATLNKDDPSRAAAHIFKDQIIDLGSKAFDGLEARIRNFSQAVEQRG